jgi:hypothetical protein
VSHQRTQIQKPGCKATAPLPDTGCTHAMLTGYLSNRRALGLFADCLENISDAVGFAWQRIEGQNALTGAAAFAGCQSYEDPRIPFFACACLKSAVDPAVCKLQAITSTSSAYTSGENGARGVCNDRLIRGRFYGKYVCHHVPRRPRFLYLGGRHLFWGFSADNLKNLRNYSCGY